MFRYPENIILLLAAIIWLWLLWRVAASEMRRRRELFASRPMFERIVGHKPTRRPVVKIGILAAALLLIGFGMMRPQGSFSEEAVMGEGLDLVVALDISKSMYTQDIAGNSRLEVAKAILSRMLNGLRDDRLGLIVFAGEAMVQSPLTYDKSAFLTFLERANPELLSRQGTDLAGAIQTSLDRFDVTASQSRVILLISDGEDDNKEKLQSAIDEASRKNIPVFAVGIGSEKGGYIPEGRTWYGDLVYKRHHGQLVVSRLDEKNLKEVAEGTGARYLRASDISSARAVVESLSNIKRIAVTGGTRMVRKELFFFPVLIAFLLLLLEWMLSERIPYERERDHWLKRI